MPGMTGWAGVSSPNWAANARCSSGVRCWPGKNTTLCFSHDGADVGDGLGVERLLEVDAADLGADGAGQWSDVERDRRRMGGLGIGVMVMAVPSGRGGSVGGSAAGRVLSMRDGVDAEGCEQVRRGARRTPGRCGRGIGRARSVGRAESARRSSTSTRSASTIASSTSWVTSSTAGRWRAHSCCGAARACGCG